MFVTHAEREGEMLQVVKKWRVVADLDKPNIVVFFIHDDQYQNVLRKLAEISYGSEVIRISIEEVQQEGIKGYKQAGPD